MRYPTKSFGDTTLVSGFVISSGACRLVGIVGFSDGVPQYVLVFEAGSIPAAGAKAKFTVVCNVGVVGNFSLTLPDSVDMDACCLATSSTPDTYTAVAGSHINAQAILAS